MRRQGRIHAHLHAVPARRHSVHRARLSQVRARGVRLVASLHRHEAFQFFEPALNHGQHLGLGRVVADDEESAMALVHLAHPAFADRRGDFVGTETRTGTEGQTVGGLYRAGTPSSHRGHLAE